MAGARRQHGGEGSSAATKEAGGAYESPAQGISAVDAAGADNVLIAVDAAAALQCCEMLALRRGRRADAAAVMAAGARVGPHTGVRECGGRAQVAAARKRQTREDDGRPLWRGVSGCMRAGGVVLRPGGRARSGELAMEGSGARVYQGPTPTQPLVMVVARKRSKGARRGRIFRGRDQSSGRRRATPAVTDAGTGARVRGPERLGDGTTWACVRPLF